MAVRTQTASPAKTATPSVGVKENPLRKWSWTYCQRLALAAKNELQLRLSLLPA